MTTSSHRIRRLRWQVNVGSPAEAFALRPRLKESVTSAILPELERAFDALQLGGDVVHIERLAAVVRVSGSGRVEQDCIEAIRLQVVDRLAALAGSPKHAAVQAERAMRRDLQRSDAAALLHYLETGALPWHLEPVTTAASHARQLAEAVRDELPSVLARLPGTAAAARTFMFRLLALLPSTDWPDIARRIGERYPHEVGADVIDAIEVIAASPEPSSTHHARVELAAALVTAGVSPDYYDQAASSAPAPPAVSADAARVGRRMALPGRAAVLIGLAEAPSAPPPGPRAFPEKPAGPAVIGGPAAPQPEAWLGEAPGVPFGIPVVHAGLILLVPFIPRLFEARHIAHPGEKTLPQPMLRRACALLHFAATGQEDGHEFETAFVKVLLGLSPDQPVPFARGVLTRGDRDEVESLLTAVVRHWRVLEHTSIDGLRAAFLQRRGLVSDEQSYWHVRVEPASSDVLLDHLPWEIGTVTLPWISKPVETEWGRS